MERMTRAAQPWPSVPTLRREIMKANRRRDTGPERALRSAMHRAGLRSRVDFPIRTPGARLIRADVVFPARRIAVFVDGCYWHGCPDHGTWPATTAPIGRRKSKRTGAGTKPQRRRSSRMAGLCSGCGSTKIPSWPRASSQTWSGQLSDNRQWLVIATGPASGRVSRDGGWRVRARGAGCGWA